MLSAAAVDLLNAFASILFAVTHLNRRKQVKRRNVQPAGEVAPPLMMTSAVRLSPAASGTLSLTSATVLTAPWIIVLLGCVTPVAAATITSQMSPRVVETQYGRLRGVLVSIADPTSTGQPARRVEVYLGLQYASLLGGRLRFMPPTGPMEKWDGVRVALKHRPVCPQPEPDLNEPGLTDRELARRKRLTTFVEKQQEDCLTLNIYVPARGQSRFRAISVVMLLCPCHQRGDIKRSCCLSLCVIPFAQTRCVSKLYLLLNTMGHLMMELRTHELARPCGHQKWPQTTLIPKTLPIHRQYLEN